jgi:DNA invertase Pin-like site-specific DNA recombinase
LTAAVGYVRVSTTEQATGGLGLEGQRSTIVAACTARGLNVADVYTDAGVSSVATTRPALDEALAAVEAAPGRVLVVAKLDRLARSLSAYAALVDRSRRNGWQLLALDTPEAATPQGEAMQLVVLAFAQMERRLISQRTVDALAAARARGVVLGRPVLVDDQVAAEILELYRRRQLNASAIAARLNASNISGPAGGVWHPGAVARVLHRAGVQLRRGRPKSKRPPARRRQAVTIQRLTGPDGQTTPPVESPAGRVRDRVGLVAGRRGALSGSSPSGPSVDAG